MKQYQAPRGTNDITPAPRLKEPEFEIHRWQWLEGLFASLVDLYGYQEIRTPMFEEIDLFLRSSGETSDVVSKEMYDFKDKGDRHLALKPEGTAPVMRAYLEHNLGQQGKIQRLWYITHSFRYGRPQKGRYRQLHQLGLECIGSSSPMADAEIIELTYRFFQEAGLQNLTVHLNSIGRAETRQRFGDALEEHLSSYLAGTSTEAQDKFHKNRLRILDSKDPAVQKALEGMPDILDYLEEDSKASFDKVQSLLTEAGVPYNISQSVVRGLDYYTDTVFEFVSQALGENLSLCGGGRYDNLMQELGGEPTPSVGVGIGLERLVLTTIAQGISCDVGRPTAYFIAADDSVGAKIRELARLCRNAGISCLYDIDHRAMNRQMKLASKENAKFAVILGPDEVASKTCTIKILESREQITIPEEELISWLIDPT